MTKSNPLLAQLRAAEKEHGEFESIELLIPDLSGVPAPEPSGNLPEKHACETAPLGDFYVVGHFLSGGNIRNRFLDRYDYFNQRSKACCFIRLGEKQAINPEPAETLCHQFAQTGALTLSI